MKKRLADAAIDAAIIAGFVGLAVILEVAARLRNRPTCRY